jgi:hypothetical protein
MFSRLHALLWPASASTARRCRPTLEALEDRTVPVTIASFGSALFTSGFGVPNAMLGPTFFGPTTATFGLTSLSGPSAFVPGFPLPGINIGLASPFVAQSSPFGSTPFGFGGTTSGVGLATPSFLQSTSAAQLSSAGIGIDISGFGTGSVAFGPGTTGFSPSFANFAFNTPGAELNTLATGLGVPGFGQGPTTALDPFFLANAAQIAQQQIALDNQLAQQAALSQIQALAATLTPLDNQTLAALQPLLLQQGLPAPVAGALFFPNVQAVTGASGNNLANVFAALSVAQHVADAQLLDGELTGGTIATARLGAAATLQNLVDPALMAALNTQASLILAQGGQTTGFNLPLALQLIQQQLPPS